MIVEQFKVESESSPGKFYVVSRVIQSGHVCPGGSPCEVESWQCSCIGWTRHVPRRDCKHIDWHKRFGGMPVDPLIASILKIRKAAERKAMKEVA